MFKSNKLVSISFFVSVAILAFALYFHTSYELSGDLGIHLLLGRIIWLTHKVPDTNLFSYTFPNHEFLNIHLLQVGYYLLAKLAGITSLIWFNALLMTGVLLMVVHTGYKISRSLIATAIAFSVFTPFLLERTEVRPETFSYLYIAIFITILSRYFNKGETKFLWVLPVTEILWVNSHIYFLVGVILVCMAFWVSLSVNLVKLKNLRKTITKTKYLLLITGTTLTATLINPFGARAIFYPLAAVANSGFPVNENSNIFQFANSSFDPNITYFLIALIIFLGSFFIRKYKWLEYDIWSIILAVLILIPIIFARTLPFLFLINFISFCDNLANNKFLNLRRIPSLKQITVTALIILSFVRTLRLISSEYYRTLDLPIKFEAKMVDVNKEAADFVQKNKLENPVFNDYNVGAYLDYRFYPRMPVFVDARPEAYPTSFGTEYSNILSNSEKFDEAVTKYGFNTVVYKHTASNTTFLTNLAENDKFELIYFDPNVVIFANKWHNSETSKAQVITPESFTYTSQNYKDYYNLFRASAMLGWDSQSEKFLTKAYELNKDSKEMLWMYGNIYSRNPETKIKGEELLSKYYSKQVVFF